MANKLKNNNQGEDETLYQTKIEGELISEVESEEKVISGAESDEGIKDGVESKSEMKEEVSNERDINESNKESELEGILNKNVLLSSLLEKITHDNAEAKEGKPLRILSIDGGGVRGIIPTMMLNYIEKKTKKPISSLFDIITGTSTGALLGVVLNIPNEKGSKVPKYNTDDALNLYMKECPGLFETSLMINLKNLWGLRSARYSSTSKRELINRYCQDLRINDCLSDIIIPAFDIREGKPYFFKSKNAEYHDKYNYKLADVLDATSAAPTYFKPCKVSNQDESQERGYRLFVDGALTANCPALCALIDSIKMYGRAPNDIFVLSLGCGDADIGVDDTTASNWGALNWAPYFPSALINGSMDTVSYQIDDLLNDPNYYRFQVRIPSKNANIDDASTKNLAWLKDCGTKFVNDNTSKLDEVYNIFSSCFSL